MTPSQLKAGHLSHHPESHFFDRDTMRHFGDTMQNYGVRDAGSHWELYRKRPVKDGATSSAYFDKETFRKTTVRPESADE